jgi:hypothetical protein
MVTKFKIGDEELDIPRGINMPNVGEGVLLKYKGEEKSYIVENVLHLLDYEQSIKQGKTLITLKEI